MLRTVSSGLLSSLRAAHTGPFTVQARFVWKPSISDILDQRSRSGQARVNGTVIETVIGMSFHCHHPSSNSLNSMQDYRTVTSSEKRDSIVTKTVVGIILLGTALDVWSILTKVLWRLRGYDFDRGIDELSFRVRKA